MKNYIFIFMVLVIANHSLFSEELSIDNNNKVPQFINDRAYSVVDSKKEKSLKYEMSLVTETYSHSSKIKDMVVTNDKSKIITVSFDKTIKVWDVNTGKLLQRIDTYTENGQVGKIEAIAISHDDKYISISGALINKKDHYKNNDIRTYDLETGKLIKVLRTEPIVPIVSLSYSPNSKYLISGSFDGEIFIWDMEKFVLKDIIATKIRSNISVKTYKNENSFILLTQQNKHIGLFDINKRKIIAFHEDKDTILHIAFNGEHYAVGRVDGKIDILNRYFKKIKTIQIDSEMPGQLRFSANNRWLAVSSGDKQGIVRVYDSLNNYKKTNEIKEVIGTTISEFVDDDTLVIAGGWNNELLIWNHKTGKIIHKISGAGKTISKVSIDDNEIIYQKIPEKIPKNSPWYNHPVQTFNLKTHTISTLPSIEETRVNRLPLLYLNYQLGYKNISKTNHAKEFYLINTITNEKKALESFAPVPYSSAGFYKDLIVILSIFGRIDIYNLEGTHIAELTGHTYAVTGLSVDNNILATCGADQTIKLWDMDKIKRHKELQIDAIAPNSPASKAGLEIGDIVYGFNDSKITDMQDFFGKFEHNQEHKLLIKRNGEKKVIYITDINGIFGFRFSNNSIHFYKTPIASIFISNENEWIIWTEDGFFDASKNGAKYIGYHINQGPYKEAEFVTVDALYSTFYRPDLIQKALAGESLEKYAKNINIDELLQDGLAPEVHILTDATNTDKQDMDLKVQVCPKAKGGYDNLTLLINDTPVSVIDTSRALKLKQKSKRDDCFIYDQTISLAGGVNNIGFRATNKAGNIESKPDFLEVTFDDTNLKNKLRTKLSNISASQNINDLHILAIAVNEYKDKDLTLKYSINDATEMLKTIQDVAKPLFNKVHTYKLFDKEVTKDNIKKAFKDIKSTREDVFLLYIAGHGITDEYNGNYYYIPYDFVNKDDEKAVQTQGVGQKDLMLGLSNVTALKSLVLLDTCNSGSFVEANMQKTTTNRLARATGRATISASSKSQVALEGYEGHGVFTYTLIEALKGEGYNGDDKITINELDDYVEKTLPDRTNEKWGYRQMPQSSMYGIDFNIGVK